MGIIILLTKERNNLKMLRTASLAAIVAMASAYNTQAGLGLSLTQNGITSGKNVAVPLIFNQTQNLQIPDFSSDGLSMTNIVASASAPITSMTSILPSEPQPTLLVC